MIENPELTRKILEYFASDEIRFPANKTLDDLKSEFSDEELDVLAYHVSCAHEEGLLEVGLTKTSTLSDGELITVGWITGLTQPGGEYVRHSQTKFWNQAKNVIQETGQKVTTTALRDVLFMLTRKALGLD